MNYQPPQFALDLFPGGVPPTAMFDLEVGSLRELLEDHEITEFSPLPGLCFIGLIAYFEAFAKDHFAALLNLCPPLVQRLKDAGRDVSIDSASFLSLANPSPHSIGFLLAERYNFGTAKEVNGAFLALLRITPFSKKAAQAYDGLLKDRNLLVHHGGLYTTRYLSDVAQANEEKRVFFDSVVIDRERVLEVCSFLENIAKKLARESDKALGQEIKDGLADLTPELARGLRLLNSWGPKQP